MSNFSTNLKVERKKARGASQFDLAGGQLQGFNPAGAEQLAQPLHQLALVRQREVEHPPGEVDLAETEGRVGGEGGEAEGEAVGGEVEGQAGEVEVDDAEVGGDGQQQGERPTHF